MIDAQTLDVDREDVVAHLQSPKGKVQMGMIGLALVLLAALYISLRFNGALATVVYAITFVVAATFIPSVVTVLRGGVPFGGAIGGLQMTLGQFCYGVGYLVEFEDRYEWCPGTEESVYIDGAWRDIESGQQNLTQLGWKPFGMIHWKPENEQAHPFSDYQPHAESGASTDGGVDSVTRGGAKQASLEKAQQQRGPVVDMKRVMNSNVRKFGDTELIERVEEIIERGEVQDSQRSAYGPMIGSIVGLVIGIIVGYASIMA